MAATISPPLLLLLFVLALAFGRRAEAAGKVLVDVGVILEGEIVGRMCNTSIAMALEDFYKKNPNYSTRIVLHSRDSGPDAIGAASAALDLLKNVQVQAILGPLKSTQASFVIDLGSRTQVPIISFSVTSPSLSPTQSPYFVRTALNSSSQVDAIASIVKAFGWRQAVPIYEDTEYGTGFLPYLIDALQDVDTRVPYRSAISPFATDDEIGAEFSKLMTKQTRVFIVHVLPPLSSRLFLKAKKLGMMSEGYAWIITNGLTDILDTLEPNVIDSMQGVVGLKPYVAHSKEFKNFHIRWRTKFLQENPNASSTNPSIFSLWAYDTAWAMAMAVEKVHVGKAGFQMTNISSSATDLASLGISRNGHKLLQQISDTDFRGISGEFHLINRQLQFSTFEVVNVFGSWGREVGFWTKAHGISRQPNFSEKKENMDLKPIIWPGELKHAPKGWEVPTNGKVLIVGVPVKGGFVEFVNTNTPRVTGYCIDVFDAVMEALPYKVLYEYKPYHFAQSPGSYNALVDQVFYQNFDAVVGDVTIIANRSLYVDFTLPYTESGVAMVVRIKEIQNKNAWIFLRPLTMELWVGSLAFFFYTGFVIWLIEHRINDEFRGPPCQQMGTIFYFAFSTLVFAHKEKVSSNLSRFVVIIWVFVVLILTSSYTASLASMLTVEQLQPSVTTVNELLKNGANVGYQDGSFVRGLLKDMKFDDSQFKNYTSIDEYGEALSKGSANGGVDAIFDEIPYIKLFLSKHCSQYVMVGPTYKTDGFGFVFPKFSPLVPDVSRAVLNVTQGKKMEEIENKWFGYQTNCATESNFIDSIRLEFTSFWGLFLITGIVSTLALLVFLGRFFHDNWIELKRKMTSESSMRRKLSVCFEHYNNWDEKSHTFKKYIESMSAHGHLDGSIDMSRQLTLPCASGSQSPFSRCYEQSIVSYDPADVSQASVDTDDIIFADSQPPLTPADKAETRSEQ